MSFINELKRRNVFKVGVAYLVGCWLLIQVADILLDNIGTPAWVLQTLFVVLGVGFFITLFFAWAFEMTPEGVKREKDVDRSQSITSQTGQKLNYVVIGMLVMAAAYFFWESRIKSGTVIPAKAGTSQSADVAEEIPASAGMTEDEAAINRQSIAVLPFDNRSRNVDDEYFTEGIHDDLLTKLARIGSLKVISRTSVTQYKETEKTIPVIAKELGVATVMEGAVQRSGDTVRINVQLIDASTDEHLWAEIFDRQLTAENLFVIQSEIATAIAQALEATLSPKEQDRLKDIPTNNIAAYNTYLRGRHFMTRRNTEDLQAALREFERAVELDPGYALAWVGIADTYSLLSVYSTIAPDIAIQKGMIAVQQALTIDDQLGEAYISQAQLFDRTNQDSEAGTAYRKGIDLSPNYVTGHHWYSGFLSDRIDKLDDALFHINKAQDLDPLSSIIAINRADILSDRGEFEQADEQLLRLKQSDPDFAPLYMRLAGFPSSQPVGLDQAIPYLRMARQLDPSNPWSLFAEAAAQIGLGNLSAAESLRAELEDINPEYWAIGVIETFISMRKGNTPGALESAEWTAKKATGFTFTDWLLVNLATRVGDYKKARSVMLTTAPQLEDPDLWNDWIASNIDDSCTAAWIFMHTGDEQRGQALLQMATDFMLNEAPRHMAHTERLPLDSCLLMQGKVDAALDHIEKRLPLGYTYFSWTQFEAPWFDTVRDNPRFLMFMEAYDADREQQRDNLAKLDAEVGL